MSKSKYDRKKVRRAMLIAPAASLLGLCPFIFQLNLTFIQFLLITLAALVISYVAGIIFGAPGYLVLGRLGYSQTKYLMAYAALLVISTPLLLDDVYALVTFGPPTLFAAGAFCYIRGPTIDTAEGAENGA